MFEIELKAHIDNPEECKKSLSAFGSEGEAFSKEDSYWVVPSSRAVPADNLGRLPTKVNISGLRIRRERTGEKELVLVSWKKKEKRDELEINEENEFELNSSSAKDYGAKNFEKLLVLLGFEKKLSKQKKGWIWQYNGITAELCEVSGIKNLGWFLELEIMAAENSAQTIAAAREKLLAMLEKSGIGKEKIENRYYTDMLQD